MSNRFALLLLLSALLLFLLPSAIYSERIEVNTGHLGEIAGMELSFHNSYLTTAGSDGTIKEFDSVSGKLLRSLQVSPLPLVDMAVHPELPRVAIVETDGVSLFLLSVWDVETEERLYSVTLGERPLHLQFSPRGTYLIFSRADWESIVVLDADTGVALKNPASPSAPLFSGFGIVQKFFVSDTERTFVAYLPSGSLQYRDMRTGKLKSSSSRIPTERDLSDLYFLKDGFHAIGRRNDQLVAINIVNGSEVASEEIDAISTIAVDSESGEVIVLHEAAQQPEFLLYAFESNRFISRYSLYQPPEASSPTSILMKDRTIFSTLPSGAIYRQTRFQAKPIPFAENRLARIDSMLPGESTFLVTESEIFTVNFQTFQDGTSRILTFHRENPLHAPAPTDSSTNGQNSTLLATEEYTLAFGNNNNSASPGIVDLRRIAPDLFLLFDEGGTSGNLAFFNPVSGIAQPIAPPTDPPLSSVDLRGFELLTVNADGSLRITDLQSGTPLFSYENFGLRTAVFADSPFIVAAGQRTGIPRTTMLRMNTVTLETVTVENPNTLTFALAYDDGRLYSANIDREATQARTVIEEHFGENFEQSRTLYETDGEFFDASLAARRGTVFFSVGGVNFLKRANSTHFLRIDAGAGIPRSVAIHGNLLYALNRDSSISLWSITTGHSLATFYLFRDGEWAAIDAKRALIAVSDGLDTKHLLSTYE